MSRWIICNSFTCTSMVLVFRRYSPIMVPAIANGVLREVAWNGTKGIGVAEGASREARLRIVGRRGVRATARTPQKIRFRTRRPTIKRINIRRMRCTPSMDGWLEQANHMVFLLAPLFHPSAPILCQAREGMWPYQPRAAPDGGGRSAVLGRRSSSVPVQPVDRPRWVGRNELPALPGYPRVRAGVPPPGNSARASGIASTPPNPYG